MSKLCVSHLCGLLQLTAMWLPWLQHITCASPHHHLPPHHATQGEFMLPRPVQMNYSDCVSEND